MPAFAASFQARAAVRVSAPATTVGRLNSKALLVLVVDMVRSVVYSLSR
jgi:hypothetical protein